MRLGVLPKSRKWTQVVALLEGGAALPDVAGASAEAAERALQQAADDPLLGHAVWLLAALPLAARAPGWTERLRELGLETDGPPSLFELTAALSATLDKKAIELGGRTDLGEMAQMALVESLVQTIEPQLPSLFTPDPAEVRTALGRLSGGERFGALARTFFSRLTNRSLNYYLSRELANHIGADRRFTTDQERRQFDQSLALHCQESARIVEAFAGGWYGKTVWQQDELTPESTQRFARYSFKKIRDELRRRRDQG
ncbi:MAG: hypothetical protein RIC87_08175 [Kiloniellales bacterium]